jgi:hypothetical protein
VLGSVNRVTGGALGAPNGGGGSSQSSSNNINQLLNYLLGR